MTERDNQVFKQVRRAQCTSDLPPAEDFPANPEGPSDVYCVQPFAPTAATRPTTETVEAQLQLDAHCGTSDWQMFVEYGTAPHHSCLELRQRIYRSSTPYLLNSSSGLHPKAGPKSSLSHPAQDELDVHSYQFMCARAGRIAAACRFTPTDTGLLDCAKLEDLPPSLRSQSKRLLQISRVVVDPDARHQKVAELLIANACQWLSIHTDCKQYFALCLPPLVRFYRHFGAQPIQNWKHTNPARAGNQYRLIQGGLTATAKATFAYLEQWHRAQTGAPVAVAKADSVQPSSSA